jgi:hypothetical protein
MMVRKIALAGLLALAACGGATSPGNDAVPAANMTAAATNTVMTQPEVAPPAAPQPDLAGARALIDRIYAPYVRDQLADLGDIYTPELDRAMEQQSDPDMGLGYDPFCSCQDFGQFSYRIVALEPSPSGATARIDRSNFGESSRVTLELAFREGRWLVADIQDSDGSLLNRR